MKSCVLAACLLIGAAMPAAAQPAPTPSRTKADWAALRDARWSLPAGERAFDVLREMNALIGSTDPFLRDNVAYEAAARWIYSAPALSDDEQRQLLAIWTANLRDGIGQSSGDGVFKRSFSALNLSVIAARDNAAPFLRQPEYDAFLDAALQYLADERDMRGYDSTRGWIHTAAHTADVLKFLARNTKLAPAAQTRILNAIDAKCASAGAVFTWAEDERLAQVVASLARRVDLDKPALEAWLATIVTRRNALWASAPAIDPARFHDVQNLKMVLRAAYVALSLDADSAPGKDAAGMLLSTLKALR
jgi:hypothetical protein